MPCNGGGIFAEEAPRCGSNNFVFSHIARGRQGLLHLYTRALREGRWGAQAGTYEANAAAETCGLPARCGGAVLECAPSAPRVACSGGGVRKDCLPREAVNFRCPGVAPNNPACADRA